jgi:hypothetical protein
LFTLSLEEGAEEIPGPFLRRRDEADAADAAGVRRTSFAPPPDDGGGATPSLSPFDDPPISPPLAGGVGMGVPVGVARRPLVPDIWEANFAVGWSTPADACPPPCPFRAALSLSLASSSASLLMTASAPSSSVLDRAAPSSSPPPRPRLRPAAAALPLHPPRCHCLRAAWS